VNHSTPAQSTKSRHTYELVDALQAMREIALINAVALVTEVGNFTRFSTSRY